MGSSSKMPTAPNTPYTNLGEANTAAMGGMGQIANGPNYANQLYNSYGGGLAGSLAATNYNPQSAVDAGGYMMGQAPGMYSSGNTLMNMGLDPQQNYYNQAFQQQQEQTRAGEAARGILTSPAGQALETQGNQFFNNMWQNQQAQRAAQMAGAAQGMYGAGAQQYLGGAGLGQGTVGNQLNWLGGLQGAGLASYAQNQQAVQNYLNYLNQGATNQQQLYNSQLQGQAQANAQGAQQGQAMGQMAGMAAMAMMMMSDERLKSDITRVGELPNGIPLYEYRYNGEDTYRTGVMAQDVLAVRPEAVGVVNGYLAVNYAMLVE